LLGTLPLLEGTFLDRNRWIGILLFRFPFIHLGSEPGPVGLGLETLPQFSLGTGKDFGLVKVTRLWPNPWKWRRNPLTRF